MHDDLEVETDEQRPIKQSFCGSLRRDAHWKCLILTMLIAGCLATIAWCRLAILRRASSSSSSVSSLAPSAASQSYFSIPGSGSYDSDSVRESPCHDGYVYIPVAFVIMLYLVYLVECWHSHTRIELQYKVDINTVYDKVRDMREGVPIIWWKAICYHYVRRTRQVTRYRNGDAFTSTQVYYERINTCTAGSAFNFTQCGVKDISRSLRGLEDYPATKIRFSKGFSFASIESECEFEDQRAQFFQEYESRDDYMEGREGMDVLNVNFKEYMIAFADPDNLPWYVSHVIFWLASFLLLSWPLRVIIEYKTAHLYYHVHKLFGTNYVDSDTFLGTLSRVSTMNSTEMEMNIRNNNFMVPSYSDAVLMNAARRASILSAMTTSGGGGLGSRVFFGTSTPRSQTNPALHNSRSGTFVPGSLPSIPMTTVRRFHSCTAINHGDKPPITQSRSSILTNLLGLNFGGSSNSNDYSAGNVLGDDNAANQRMDRRRWRRKRPTSCITYSGSLMGSMLPTTPETPDGYLIEMDSVTGSAIVTHFHADDNTVTTTSTTNNPSSRVGGGSVPPSTFTRPLRGGGGGDSSSARVGLPYVGSSQSMTLSETFSGNFSSATPSEGEPPPPYTDALGMAKLYRSDSQGLRIVLPDGHHTSHHPDSSNGDLSRVRVHQNGDAVRPRLQHSESLRLFSGGGGGGGAGGGGGRAGDRPSVMFYRSTSQGLDRHRPQNHAGLIRNGSAPRLLTRSESQGFGDRRVDNAGPSSRPDRARSVRLPPGSERVRLLHMDDPDQCPGQVLGVGSPSTSSAADDASYQATATHSSSSSHPRRGNHNSKTTSDSPYPNQDQGQTLRAKNGANSSGCPPPQRRIDFRSGSPAASSALPSALSLDVDDRGELDRSGNVTARARPGLDLSRIPLRLPAVVAPCRTLSDDDEDLSPLRDSGSLISLIGSSNSLAGSDRHESEPETGRRSVRGIDNPTPLSLSPMSSPSRAGEGAEGGAAAATSTTTSAAAAVTTAAAAAASQPTSAASANMRLISPSTAQRCYRSIRCMETSL